MRVRLNKRAIDSATYKGAGADYRWDTELPSFGVRVYPSGRKSFVITYRVRGKQRFYTLGRFGEMTLQEARTLALEHLGKARRGEDPAGERLAYRRAPTMKDLFDRYMTEHALVHKKASSAGVDRSLWQNRVLPALGGRKVADITRGDISALHSGLSKTPALANQVRRILCKAFNLAEVWEWRPDGSNPTRHVKRFKEEKRERFLSSRELKRLSAYLVEAERSGKEGPETIAALRLLILTGCRRGEILNLRWQDVDFEARCLRLPDSKTGAKVVFLNAPALQVLAGVKHHEGTDLVLPGRSPGRPITLKDPWERIRKAVNLEDVRIHDLRHTYASVGVSSGLSLSVIGGLLGHSQLATTERYSHLADDPVRQGAERIGAAIEAAMLGKKEAEVVYLEGSG
jgi:integrase